MESNTILFSTPRFNIIFIAEFDQDDELDGPYHIVNKDTGVHEFCTTAYAGALEMVVRYEIAIDMMTKQLAEHVNASKPTMAEENLKVQNLFAAIKDRNTSPDLSAYRVLDDETE